MLVVLLIFFISALVSFLGSVQLGPVNLYVINTVLNNNKKAALLIAFGGCLPEFIFCAFAIYANTFLSQSEVYLFSFKIIFILILLVISIVLFFKKNTITKIETTEIKEEKKSISYIAKGFALAALNPQLLPFWLLVLTYFNSIKVLNIQSKTQKISFILGSGVGAFLLLSLLVVLVTKYREPILKKINHRYYYKILSILFFIIALQQLILLINKT